jgi:transposase
VAARGACTTVHAGNRISWEQGARILGKISKRGNRYLRVLFVQAAWAVLIKPSSWERHGLKHWIEAARKRLHRNVLAIALANKLARIAWGVLAGSRTFEASKLQAA